MALTEQQAPAAVASDELLEVMAQLALDMAALRADVAELKAAFDHYRPLLERVDPSKNAVAAWRSLRKPKPCNCGGGDPAPGDG